MDFDIPTDLINNSQILFRDLAGLQSFTPNPKLQSPPSISTLEPSISTLDPSPENLRCNYCQGKLLRGLQSLICIYCGEYQKNNKNNDDGDSDPICFNSTHGYSWLLQSLNFNGSERVGSLAEGSGINGGQSPAEDEATLSELLDLKISRPKQPDNKISKRNSFVNLGTADVDNFFIESKRATVSNVVPEEINQNKAFDDDSSGWTAEFQSADTEIMNESSKSVDPFVGAEVDLSSQMDAVFGQMESFNNKKPNDDSDLFPSDDSFANTSSENFQLAEPLDSVVQANDGLPCHLNSHNSKSVDAVFGQKESFNNKKTKDDLDLFPSNDPFANISSKSSQQAEQLDSVVQANDGLSGHLNSHNSKSGDAVFGQMESFNNKKPNDDLDLFPSNDPFANISSKSFQQAEQLDSVVQANDGLLGHLNSHNSKSVDAVFGHMESFNKRKLNDDLDLFPSDDPFANMSSESFQQAEQLGSVVQANDSLSGHLNIDNSKSVDAVFGQMESFNNRKPNDDLDLFSSDDPFANMSSESFRQAEPLDSVVQAKDSLSGQIKDLKSKSVDHDWFNDNNWQKSGASLNNASSTEGVSVDWFENTNWQKSSVENTATVKDDNLFDIKPLSSLDLDNSNKHHSEATNWFQDSQWSIGASSSTNILASKDNDGDGFDEWNDFTSSTVNQDSFLDSRKDSSNEKVAVNEKMSELNLFSSTADPQEVVFGNFLQSADLFSGSSSNKKPNDNQTEYGIFPEVSTASRNANSEAGNNPEGLKNDEIAPNTTTSSKDDVQMLMSQMHDLSFMLKSELSIPSKPDNLDP